MKSHQLNYIIEETVASRTEIHKFYGSPIVFTLQKELKVNATQMAKRRPLYSLCKIAIWIKSQ